ncbi:tol-pal system YbgF family protein [Amycolatopsis sp. NPDC059657]|uniref:tetratricopeptide repeat protein n=1 Tax=Amycolatopsis sp. NPDC059657 TaxID=3346899 RepID=UPI003670C139
MTGRRPNDPLRSLLAEAGWTGGALAAAVNTIGAEAGLRLGYDRTSVAHWLSGSRPRSPVPDLVAEAFSRRLGREIPVALTGLAGRTESVSPSLMVEPKRIYRLAELDVPSLTELALPAQRDGVGRVGRAEAAAAASMIEVFSDTDVTFGGGTGRTALAGYLAHTIAPWLRADAVPAVRHELLHAASLLTYLNGFMCFDDELHGAAQGYYLASARLAAQAADATGYAVALRALSVQALMLGHHRHAVHLAEAAVAAAAPTASPRTRAFLHGQLAVACAASGDRQAAVTQLGIAENRLAAAHSADVAIGGYHEASLAHQHAAVAASLGDRQAAIRALKSSIFHRPATERRSRAITLARLAELQLSIGQLDQACDTWHRFLDDYPQLRSRRADTALATLRAQIRPHQKNPSARVLGQRAALVLSARRTP